MIRLYALGPLSLEGVGVGTIPVEVKDSTPVKMVVKDASGENFVVEPVAMVTAAQNIECKLKL